MFNIAIIGASGYTGGELLRMGPVCRSCQSTARRYYRRRDPLPAALIGEEPRFWDVMRSRQDESSWLHPPRWAPVLEKDIFEGKVQLESAVM